MRKIGYNHMLCKELQKAGYSVRLSRDIVNLLFDNIKAGLVKDKLVELPIGTFTLIPEKRKSFRRYGLNGPETVYKHKNRIKFKYKG